MVEVAVGSKIRPDDYADLFIWIEKKVNKRSKANIDMVWLPLVVAEVFVLLIKEHWSYCEPVDETISGIRLMAEEFAKKMDEHIKG